jgi:hypothetical protein
LIGSVEGLMSARLSQGSKRDVLRQNYWLWWRHLIQVLVKKLWIHHQNYMEPGIV